MKNVTESLKKAYQRSIISSICFIVIGLFLVFQSHATITVISYIIGGVLIAMGIAAFIRYFQTKGEQRTFTFDLVYGIITVIVGLIFVINPEMIASFIPFVLGVWIILSGAFKFQNAFSLKALHSEVWVGTLVIAILMVVCGLVLLFNPFAGAIVITKLIGIFMVIYAILDVITAWLMKKDSKRTSGPPEAIYEVVDDSKK